MPTLSIDIEARLAKFQDSLDQIGRQGQQMANRLEGAFGGLKTMLGGLVAGASVGAFVGLVRSAINAGDELYKMSQKVGISVERLSELKFAAELSDVSMDQFQVGMKGLVATLTKASDATSKEAQLLKLLGVTATEPVQALRQVADAFAALPDGATKSTLAVELFGKAGLAMIPMLNGGSKALDDAAESARKLGLVMSAEAAKAAEEFNDNMTKLSKGSEALGIAIAGKLVGGLASFTSGLVKAKEEGRLLERVMNDLLGVNLELAAKLPIIGKAFETLRDLNAQRVAEEQASIDRRTSAGKIGGGLVGPPPPADLEARLKKLLAADGGGGAKGMTLDELLAQGSRKRDAMQDAETEAGEKQAAEDEKDRLTAAYEAAQARAKAEDDYIDKLHESLRLNRELRQSYLDLIDPVEKYRRQLADIDKLLESGDLTSEQAEMARERVNDQVRKLSTDLDKSKDLARELGFTFQSAFEDAIVGGKKFRDVLAGIAQDIARIVLRKSVTEPAGNAIVKALGDLDFSKVFRGDSGSSWGSLVGGGLKFAAGGSFMVGGSGGTDSQLVAFRASPDERVTVETPEQQRRGAGNTFHFSIDARGADHGVAQRIESAVRQAVQLSLQAVQAQADRGGAFARAVGRR